MHDVTMLITEDLHLDVFGRVDKLLKKNCFVAECGFRFPLCFIKQLLKTFFASRHAHAPTTATCSGLDHYRETYVLRFPESGRIIREIFFAVLNERYLYF